MFCASHKPSAGSAGEENGSASAAPWPQHPLSGSVPTRTRSAPDPEHPAPSSGTDRRTDGAVRMLTGIVRPRVPLTVYCPSFGVSSSSRSCCLRAWKSSSARQRRAGAVATSMLGHRPPCRGPSPVRWPSGEDTPGTAQNRSLSPVTLAKRRLPEEPCRTGDEPLVGVAVPPAAQPSGTMVRGRMGPAPLDPREPC